MDATEVLSKLADAAGIESHYWDMHGERHETTPDTIRGLLKAFRIPAESEAEARASLETFWRAPWMRLLPPVLVADGGEVISVALRVPEEAARGEMPWSVVLEDGTRRDGTCRLEDLPRDDIGYFDDKRIFQLRLQLDPLPLGYHRFEAGGAAMRLIVAPRRCYLPARLATHKVWGLMLQLYSLKSQKDWGVGDFSDLKLLIDSVAQAGGDAIGLNPLHALFLDTPANASPYSPCSRLFRNPLYLDVTAVEDFSECNAAQTLASSGIFRTACEQARITDLVDYPTVASLKLPVLELLYRSFADNHLSTGDARANAFQAYVSDKGDDLEGLCDYQALVEELGSHDWSSWPQPFRDRDAAALASFRQSHAARIGFFRYLQWLCELQFTAAAEQAKARSMAVGLYNDLAVSVDASSADHWTHQSHFASGARVGAPPDPFNEKGQDWGLVPLNPLQLRETGFTHFAALLRANMRHAGALRIDHVMGLTRLFLIPPGATAASGAYVRYPLTELLAIAALESQRNHCLIIGEDLGTVPAGFRERLAGANVLSSRVLYFERSADGFNPPKAYPGLAAVSVSTHDLATLEGYWVGDDLAAKDRLGLFKDETEKGNALKARSDDKRHLLAALAEERLLPEGVAPDDAATLVWTPQLTAAVHAYLGGAPSTLFMVQMDDFVGQVHQANLPGSVTEYPNWRRRLVKTLEELIADRQLLAAMMVIGKARG
jgi:(1->4)-alpha-D-glucan 1-alpha-D-glucosylmutase